MDFRILLVFLFSLVGGVVAFMIGVPMPFLLGGIFGAAGFVLYYERDGRELPKVSRWVRLVFAAIIGSMIGTRFSPELLPLLPEFWISALAIVPFILLAHGGNYAIMRLIGRYRRLDAYFASLPGGIVDSVSLAEEANADVRVVTAQHFIRIILVVATVPLLFWVVQGNAVGSIAGESLAMGNYSSQDIIVILAIAAVGLFAGRAMRLPVAHLTGPLLLGLAVAVTGSVSVSTPFWLQHVAQYMIGASLGAQFSGISRKLLVRGLGVGLLSGIYMLALAAAAATVLAQLVPADFGALFISFAAGGLAEMSLIALTLNFNPVVVALHHLARIFLTVWFGVLLFRYGFKLEPKA
ncbi:MAG: AbrB family transcriptional regulator [Rhizobiaceae bacterium]